jgi:hypothetical protein
LLKTGQLSIGVPHALEDLIDKLKGQGAPQKSPSSTDQKNGDAANGVTNNTQEVLDRLDHLEHQLTDMNDRLRRIEASLPGSKSD